MKKFLIRLLYWWREWIAKVYYRYSCGLVAWFSDSELADFYEFTGMTWAEHCLQLTRDKFNLPTWKPQ